MAFKKIYSSIDDHPTIENSAPTGNVGLRSLSGRILPSLEQPFITVGYEFML